MTLTERDELARLVREIDEHFPIDNLAELVVDFCFWTRGVTYKSFWDVPDAELLATVREIVESQRVAQTAC